MKSRKWNALFVHTVLASLAAVSATACETSVSTGEDDGAREDSSTPSAADSIVSNASLDDSGLEAPIHCTEGDDSAIFDALRELLQLDHLELRRNTDRYDETSGIRLSEQLHASGSPCANATDVDACTDQVDRANSDDSGILALPTCANPSPESYHCTTSTWSMYFVYSKGDEVGVVGTKEDLLAWIGDIDHPAKAWLAATQAGYRVRCDQPWIRRDGDDYLLRTEQEKGGCIFEEADVLLRVLPNGQTSEHQRLVRKHVVQCGGRRPQGFQFAVQDTSRPALGTHFARLAQLETASIDAFRILRDELEFHGAPPGLIREAEKSAQDEIRHAHTVTTLAEHFGARVALPTVHRGPVRSLETIAIENAREGCVREAYGALEASWQAREATDREVRNVMGKIALDEIRHAAFSWKLAAWLDTQLPAEARARVAAERERAAAELADELRNEPEVVLVREAGVPSTTHALQLLEELMARLEQLDLPHVA